MQKQRRLRCPYCSVAAVRDEGWPILPGHLVVCAACAGPSRFDDAGERLVLLEAGDLNQSVVADVLGIQKSIRATFEPNRGHPPGLRWGAGALCRPCWDEFEPGRVPVVVKDAPEESCAFCEQKTMSGIYRRMLLPC